MINSTSGTNKLSFVRNNGIESIYLNGIRIRRISKPNFYVKGNIVQVGKYATNTDTNPYTVRGFRIYVGNDVYPDIDNVSI